MKHLKQENMKTFKENQRRSSYMSLADMAQDLTTEKLVEMVKNESKFNNQMILMTEIEKRNELTDNEYFELLESCNGI